MSKLLTGLVQKAREKGFARVNGRQWDYGSYGNLQEKYAIEIKDNTATLRHWGTVTLVIDTEKKTVLDVYGISNSDRDSVNFMLNEFNVPYHVHYYPSREEFELHQDGTDRIIKVV